MAYKDPFPLPPTLLLGKGPCWARSYWILAIYLARDNVGGEDIMNEPGYEAN